MKTNYMRLIIPSFLVTIVCMGACASPSMVASSKHSKRPLTLQKNMPDSVCQDPQSLQNKNVKTIQEKQTPSSEKALNEQTASALQRQETVRPSKPINLKPYTTTMVERSHANVAEVITISKEQVYQEPVPQAQAPQEPVHQEHAAVKVVAEPQKRVLKEKYENIERKNTALKAITPQPDKGLINASNDPVDYSDQYTGYDGPVPLIINSTFCGKNKYEIKVDVDNVPDDRGFINVDLHDDNRDNFLVGAKAVVRVRVSAKKGRTSLCIPLAKPGDYAVAIYHDKNNNLKFDKNFLGIPKERFGMSNNPKFGTKSPKYEQAIFTVPESGANIVIKLRKASDILGKQE